MTSNEDVLCEKCGAVMESRIEGSTSGVYCTNCEWSVVTTYMPEIVLDSNKYKVYLLSADPKNREQLKAISTVANVNFLQARKMFLEERALVLEDEAVAIDKVRKLFDECFIRYEIEPPFPY